MQLLKNYVRSQCCLLHTPLPLAANATVCKAHAQIYVYEATKVAASIDIGFSYVPRVFMKLATTGAAGCIINAPKSIF